MKELKQIVLCSQVTDYSFIRNIQLTNEYASVTSIEKLPFRYHEFLLKRRKKKDREAIITVDFREPERLRCAFCDNRGTFECDRCGYLSCSAWQPAYHYCPGCRKTLKTKPVDRCHGSDSGFIGINLFQPTTYWLRAQDALLELIEHRNRGSR